jgi:putative ATP-dependent endonuclease of the OLD family
MARIRKIHIQHFRSIKELTWLPSPGVNCLIGPGDSGKSSILDAIDYCVGARRNVTFTDADFFGLNVEAPVSISITLGQLDDDLRNIDTYGLFVQSFNPTTGAVAEEPETGHETVLSVNLTVGSDLEPVWTLVSQRAAAQGSTRNLNWKDRLRLAPTRVGATADYHLGWSRGSVLNRVSEERAEASAALAKAARDARAAFGDQAEAQLQDTLTIVAATAQELGVPTGATVKAMLDAHSVSFTGGTISLHNSDGIPLRSLGAGSTRLLVTGLQRKAAERASIILIDELEHGLEPHRIVRLLGSLGAKDASPPLQVFMTTHSPVVLRELSGNQLWVIRAGASHTATLVGVTDDIQSTIRLFPEAFLAPAIIVCEGATEVGLIRGIDQFRTVTGKTPIGACGVGLIDCGGGEPDRPVKRAAAFLKLGYRVCVVRDDDQRPNAALEQSFVTSGGKIIVWRYGRVLEEELFLALTSDAGVKLLDRAVKLHGEQLIDDHIKSASNNGKTLVAIQTEALLDNLPEDSRVILSKAAKTRRSGWFKSVSWMEETARDIVGPELVNGDPDFYALIEEIFTWAENAG